MSDARCQFITLAFLVGWLINTDAALLQTTFNGTVTVDNHGNNPFGLVIGDTVYGVAFWDDARVASGPDFPVFINGLPSSEWNFTITLGTYSFSQADVTDPAATRFWFDFGSFDGIDFFIESVDIGVFSNMLIQDFSGGRALFVEDMDIGFPVYLEAEWDFPNAVTGPASGPPIPIPPSIMLMLPALLLLHRRKVA